MLNFAVLEEKHDDKMCLGSLVQLFKFIPGGGGI